MILNVSFFIPPYSRVQKNTPYTAYKKYPQGGLSKKYPQGVYPKNTPQLRAIIKIIPPIPLKKIPTRVFMRRKNSFNFQNKNKNTRGNWRSMALIEKRGGSSLIRIFFLDRPFTYRLIYEYHPTYTPSICNELLYHMMQF